MELTVKSLQEAGAFTGVPVEKEIKWIQDDQECTATTYIRKYSYASVIEEMAQLDKGSRIAGRIATCICDKDGKPVFTVKDITGESSPERGPLNYNLTLALLAAIGEVNGLSGESKTQRKKMKSGTN